MNHITVIARPMWRVSNHRRDYDGTIVQTFADVEDAKTAYAAAVNDPRSTWVALEQLQKLAECIG